MRSSRPNRFPLTGRRPPGGPIRSSRADRARRMARGGPPPSRPSRLAGRHERAFERDRPYASDRPDPARLLGCAQMLHVHRSERADGLVAALRELLADPLPDPFASEVVCVPTRGMERWLSQRLSAGLGARPGLGDGVCANVDFPSPWRLATDVVAAATGIEPEADPWRPERAVWPLLRIVGENLGEPWLGPLSTHAGGPAPVRDRPPPRGPVRRLCAPPPGDAGGVGGGRGRGLAGRAVAAPRPSASPSRGRPHA